MSSYKQFFAEAKVLTVLAIIVHTVVMVTVAVRISLSFIGCFSDQSLSTVAIFSVCKHLFTEMFTTQKTVSGIHQYMCECLRKVLHLQSADKCLLPPLDPLCLLTTQPLTLPQPTVLISLDNNQATTLPYSFLQSTLKRTNHAVIT